MIRMPRFLAIIVAALAVAGCGGGGETVARIGGGGTGAPVSAGAGTVGGFGSVIVHGQHFDETAAQIAVDERPDQPTSASVEAIRLGSQIQFEHQSNRLSKATIAAEVIGPVTSLAADTLVVMGQTVRVNADPALPTTFDGFMAVSDLARAIVEVHGQRDASGQILATRIELRPASSVLRVAGTVTNLAGGAFRIGELTVRSAQAAIVPAGQTIANGQRVAAWTDQALSNGELVARVVRIGGSLIASDAALTIEGVITDYQSSSSLKITGVSVDASAATFVGGAVADLGNGEAVRASGTYTSNVLRASRIEFLSAATARVELNGAISGFVDVAGAFRVRDTTVKVSPQTTYSRGDVSNLGDGVLVKVEGPLVNGVVEAMTLEFLQPSAGIARVLFGTVADLQPTASGKSFLLSPLPLRVETTARTTFKKGAEADLANGRGIKVDGTYDGVRFLASEIQFMDNVKDPPTFEIDGIASNVQPASVAVEGKTIALTPSTVYTRNDAAAVQSDLKNGSTVEVTAVKLNGQLYAQRVEIKELASGTASAHGIVSDRADDSDLEFLVGSQRVSVAGNPMVVPGNKSLKDIKNGTDLEVEGTMSAGLLTATRVKFR
jgi:hypothetical protein